MMRIKKEDFNKKINVNSSGISLGHPIGATGAIRLLRFLSYRKSSKVQSSPFRVDFLLLTLMNS